MKLAAYSAGHGNRSPAACPDGYQAGDIMLVSAAGFEPVASNRYHTEGRAAGRVDVLLRPSPP